MTKKVIAKQKDATLAIRRIPVQPWEIGFSAGLSPLALRLVVGTNSASLFAVSAPQIAFLRLLKKYEKKKKIAQ